MNVMGHFLQLLIACQFLPSLTYYLYEIHEFSVRINVGMNRNFILTYIPLLHFELRKSAKMMKKTVLIS